MNSVATANLDTLRNTVQHNCHISDANFAGNYTMCIYLLKMREFFRWEQRKKQSSKLERNQVGDWLRERESLWDSLESSDYKNIKINNKDYDPFDSEAINAELNKQGLVYSGGLGTRLTPHFFLAKLQTQESYQHYTVNISTTEYARDLTSPPAMTLGNTIFIRRESVKRMIWEQYEHWQWNQLDNAMKHAIDCYDFKNNLDASLEKMTDTEIENILSHEIGEIQAGELLGEQWEKLLLNLPGTKAEIMLRAIRDHLADSITTLPTLLHNNNKASIHFYFANLTHMRKHLSPSLMDSYKQWLQSDDLSAMKKLLSQSRTHWLNLTSDILELHATNKQPQNRIEALIESSRL